MFRLYLLLISSIIHTAISSTQLNTIVNIHTIHDPAPNHPLPPASLQIPLADLYAAYTEDDIDDDRSDFIDYSDIERIDSSTSAYPDGFDNDFHRFRHQHPATHQLISLGGTSRMLRAILQRGKELLQILPSLTAVAARQLFEHIPTVGEIVNCGKQTLFGLPQEVIAYAFDAFCATAISTDAVRPRHEPDLEAMHYVLMTLDGREIRVPLQQSQRLWHHRLFRPDWPVVLVITGWNSNVNASNEALDVLHAAYRQRGEWNFVAIDMDRFVDTLYTWSAFSTRPLGRMVGEALANLTEFVRPKDVHVIGHSLGAHISGEAGRTYRQITGRSLPRITGLDPARPCFNQGERLAGLHRDDADFVDVIHSNSGILGQKRAIGDVDFYPNGRDPLQPGCWTIFCAHSRSYEYFAETVYPGQEDHFEATLCHKLGAYKRGRCVGPKLLMGLLAHGGPTMQTGSYFLLTNREKPYGQPRRRASQLQLDGNVEEVGNATGTGDESLGNDLEN